MGEESVFCSKCGKKVLPKKDTDLDIGNSPIQDGVQTTICKSEKEFIAKTCREENKSTEGAVTKKNKKKSKVRVKVILVILVLAVISGGCFGYNKYCVKIRYSSFERAKERFNSAVDYYNQDHFSYENLSEAGLAMLEAYLHYYKTKINEPGNKNYSEMNNYMEEMISLVQENQRVIERENWRIITNMEMIDRLLDEKFESFHESFNKKFKSICTEWKKIKR